MPILPFMLDSSYPLTPDSFANIIRFLHSNASFEPLLASAIGPRSSVQVPPPHAGPQAPQAQ